LTAAAVGLSVAAVGLSVTAAGAGASTTGTSSALETLSGSLQLAPTSCANGSPSGSFLEVTDGVKDYTNPDSTCDGGAVTLLPPGTTGIPLGRFAADPDPTFAPNGDSLSNLVIQPTSYNGHKFGIGTSPYDVQDAPTGPLAYPPPQALVQGSTLTLDLRSLDVTFEGPPGSTCASAEGLGCWEEGTKAATGTFNALSHQFTLNWLSSQGFTGQAVGVVFHLEGTLVGQALNADSNAGAQQNGSVASSASSTAGAEAPSGASAGSSESGADASSGSTSGAGNQAPPSGSGTGAAATAAPAGAGERGVATGSASVPGLLGLVDRGSSATTTGSSSITETSPAGTSPSPDVAAGVAPGVGSASSGSGAARTAASLPDGERPVASDVVTDEMRVLRYPKAGGILAALAALFFAADAFWLGMRLRPNSERGRGRSLASAGPQAGAR
jgi:hypothetical protein